MTYRIPWAVLGLVLGSACGKTIDDSGEPPVSTCSVEGNQVTWTNHAEPWLRTWCTPCHHSGVQEIQRQGAPVGVDFETYDDAVVWADRILARGVEAGGNMPPAGGVSDESKVLIEEWIACGMQGGVQAPADPCEGEQRLYTGDLVVQTAADLDTFCVDYNAIDGDLVLNGGDKVQVDCLCEVTGSVVIEDSSVSSVFFPSLTTVGSDVRASNSGALEALLLPELTDVGGALSMSNNEVLTQLDVDFLQHAGSILVQENAVLQDFRPSRILTVEHDFAVEGNDTLSTISLDRILTVGGNLRIVGNARMHTILGDAYQMQSIGGDLVFENNALLQNLYGFVDVTEIGGSLEVVGNSTLESIYGFTHLERVGGHIRLHNNDTLYGIDGFDFIEVVPEEFEVSNNPVLRFLSGFRILSSVGLAGEPGTPQREVLLTDLPSLQSISAFNVLEEAGAMSIVRTGLTEPGRIEALRVVHGDFFILQNPMMDHLDGFQSLETVEGTIQLGTNGQLISVMGLHSVQQVTGDLWVHDNSSLPLVSINDMLNAIGVANIDGAVIVSGNGG